MNLDEAIAQLRKLNEPVPKPFRLPTADEVKAAEKQLGVKFPDDYKHFLLEASDVAYGSLEPAVVIPNAGHLDLITMVEAAWQEDGVPGNLLPFCEDNGDYFCLNIEGEVVFWTHNGTSNESWPDLATWIEEVWINEA